VFQWVVGVPHAGDPLAAAYSEQSGVPCLRLAKTTSGEQRSITSVLAGTYHRGESVLLIDDLVTQADSKLEAIETLSAAGLNTFAVAVVLDREQGGATELRQRGYPLLRLYTLTEFLETLGNGGRLSHADVQEILAYIRTNS